jgi:hypothetical protein
MSLLTAIILALVFVGLLYAARRWAPPWLKTATYVVAGIAILLAFIAFCYWALVYFGVFGILEGAHIHARH